ncbi:AtuA-related protein [Anderseniella sp. Alg231-50]|uniref:AtuA-related protein n=1 Tax=Anderseniella sp. Alg231-50 TaxID=1922226 RepID=UPI00307C8A59
MTDLAKAGEMIAVRHLAHGRAGDKGNRLNISVIAFDPQHFDHLKTHVTEELCGRAFAFSPPSGITRYVLPNLGAMNFVLEDVLDGGVNVNLRLDRHGKTLCYALLDMLIPAPPGWGDQDQGKM